MFTIIIITVIVATAGLGLPGDTPEHYKTSLKNWKLAIIEHVEDEDREEKALEIIDSAATNLITAREELVLVSRQLMEVDSRYNATMREYEDIITSVNALWRKADNTLITKRFEMQETLTEEEWLLCMGYIQKATSKLKVKMGKKVDQDTEKRARQIEKLEQSQ